MEESFFMIEIYCETYYTVLTLVNYLENSPIRLSQVVLNTFQSEDGIKNHQAYFKSVAIEQVIFMIMYKSIIIKLEVVLLFKTLASLIIWWVKLMLIRYRWLKHKYLTKSAVQYVLNMTLSAWRTVICLHKRESWLSKLHGEVMCLVWGVRTLRAG